MHNIIKDRLLINQEIERNFIGIVHDSASSLTGKYNGLVRKLQEDKNDLFSLRDPCHCFNLILKNSLTKLPKNIMKFVTKIHLHFKSPQRKAILSNIQKENNEKQLALKPYIKTRWLSLGSSLERLIEIWGSLKTYMEQRKKSIIESSKPDEDTDQEEENNEDEEEGEEEEIEEVKKFNYDFFFNLLSDENFYLQIRVLAFFNLFIESSDSAIHTNIQLYECKSKN